MESWDLEMAKIRICRVVSGLNCYTAAALEHCDFLARGGLNSLTCQAQIVGSRNG